jgi:hypothetical protein
LFNPSFLNPPEWDKIGHICWLNAESRLLCSQQGAEKVVGMSLRSSEEVIENFFRWAVP